MNTIVSTLSYLMVLVGGFSFVAGILTKQSTVVLIGCILGAFGLVLIVLLFIAQTLKDIRLNTRESLTIQRSTLQSGIDSEGTETLIEDPNG